MATYTIVARGESTTIILFNGHNIKLNPNDIVILLDQCISQPSSEKSGRHLK